MTKKVLAILLISLTCNAASVNKCDNALSACKALVSEQDTSITMLKAQVKVLEGQVVTAEDKQATLPWYVYVIIGAAGGLVGGVVLVK